MTALMICCSTTIYLNPQVSLYAKEFAERLPGNLKVVYFVNSGSEANDLALLMARLYTGANDIIALRNCYHGTQSHSKVHSFSLISSLTHFFSTLLDPVPFEHFLKLNPFFSRNESHYNGSDCSFNMEVPCQSRIRCPSRSQS
jgi:4-aminobutyrate aminotransferase-like enzyme